MTSKDKVFAILTNPKTIPQICKECGFRSEFVAMRAIAELEYDGKVILHGFDKFCEPDGRAGYLARYGRKEAEE